MRDTSVFAKMQATFLCILFSLAAAAVAGIPALPKQAYNLTLVTALHNIERQDRPFEQYLAWFRDTLQIPLPMVVFCRDRQRVATLVWDMRSQQHKRATAVVLEESFPLSGLEPRVAELTQDEKKGSALEWTNAKYIPLTFSKFAWIKEAILKEYLPPTEYYCWVDAGISRFFWRHSWGWPWNPLGSAVLRFPDLVTGTLHGQIAIETALNEPADLAAVQWDAGMGSLKNWFKAGVFGGDAHAMVKVSDAMLDIFLVDMLNGTTVVDNEQAAFALLFSRHPEWFRILFPGDFGSSNYNTGCNFICL